MRNLKGDREVSRRAFIGRAAAVTGGVAGLLAVAKTANAQDLLRDQDRTRDMDQNPDQLRDRDRIDTPLGRASRGSGGLGAGGAGGGGAGGGGGGGGGR